MRWRTKAARSSCEFERRELVARLARHTYVRDHRLDDDADQLVAHGVRRPAFTPKTNQVPRWALDLREGLAAKRR